MDTIPLQKIYSGKVRDLYEIDDKTMLMVASDRLSAFDVIMDQPIPKKGELLTQISLFWFKKLAHILPNQLTNQTVYDVLPEDIAKTIEKRAIVVKRLTPIKCEAVVRGYITGSGWKEYQAKGSICGINLPNGLQEAQRLPEILFTPSTKADIGGHDENISFAQCCTLLGADIAEQVRKASIQLYRQASEYAETRGLIIADTKFEFGIDENGKLTLMDEVLTPDSSRFWAKSTYEVGISPPSFDKQFIRNWLENISWNKQPPAPAIPKDVLQATLDKYYEAFKLLTQ